MGKYAKYLYPAMSLLFGAAVLCFFGLVYPYHVHYQEQYQIFQFTGSYFLEVFSVPGGLADYIGRFLTQFFFYAWSGSFIIALILTAIQLLTFAVSRHRFPGQYALSFTPAITLVCALCDESTLMGTPVAILLAQVCALAVLAIKGEVPRRALFLILIPILYFLLGPLSIVFVLTVILVDRKLWLFFTAIAVAALCPVIAHQIFPFPLQRLIIGVHYHRFHNIVQAWPWIAVAFIALSAFLGSLKGKWYSYGKVFDICTLPMILLLAITPVRASCDFVKEETMKYDFMVRWNLWDRVISEAKHKMPDNPMTVSCLNLALSTQNLLQTDMFHYFQNGPIGLLPDFVRDFTSPLPTAEAYYHLGMVNTAQRFTFEAQEAIPDFQKSARCCKRLVQTNLINGDYDVAEKYLEMLKHTLYYRAWALQTESLLGDEDAINSHPEYGTIRKLRLRDHDFLYSDTEMDSMLGLLFIENPDNSIALDYLLAWSLLSKNLPRFQECLQLVNFTFLPTPYEEALILLWAQTHNGSDNENPPVFSDMTRKRFIQFIDAQRANRTQDFMEKNFGDTYWFYYFYRYK